MSSLGIIGFGVVGQTVARGFQKKHKIFWYDKYKKGPWTQDEVVGESEFIFVCVPTPMYDDHSGTDLSVIDGVVDAIAPKIAGTDKILVIKSTVLPGTIAVLQAKYPKTKIASNPEFLTETRPDWDFLHPDRTIIGAKNKVVAERLKKLYLTILPKSAKFFLIDTTSAELAKYASNVLLGAKIILATEIYNIAKALKVDYEGVREMTQADPRIGGHMKVPGPDGLGYGFGGKCLPKDTVGFIYLGKKLGVDLSVISAIWKKNLAVRTVRDWETIPGAVHKRSRFAKIKSRLKFV